MQTDRKKGGKFQSEQIVEKQKGKAYHRIPGEGEGLWDMPNGNGW